MQAPEIQQIGKDFNFKQQELFKTSIPSTVPIDKTQGESEIPFPKFPIDKDVYENLNRLFTDQDKEQRTVREAREILGDPAEKLTDEQIYNLVTNAQYLVDSWLEEFERKIFGGKTLSELLRFENL